MADMFSLPWKPLYSQIDMGESIDLDSTNTAFETYAVALTIFFTVSVFAFEHFLDHRQAKAYKGTTFPQELELAVSKIDDGKKRKGRKDGESKSSESKSESKEEVVDKDQPILPQLRDKFTKSQVYGTDKINFQMVCAGYNLVETVVFLMLGFMPYAWDMSVDIGETYFSWTKEDEIKISLVFLALTTVIGIVTGLPFELYSTFNIEKKHGFNKQTLRLFFTDKVKSTILTVLIGGPFVAALLKLIKWGGDYFYLYVWAFMFVFSVVMMTLVPVFIMPLFNKYETLPDSELKTRIYALAEKINYPLNKLFVMDGSKRSSHSNAFMFGFGNNKRIVLFDTLMEQVEDDEILAILGHELGHWKLGHTLANLVVTQTYMGAAFYSFSLCYNSTGLYRAFGFTAGTENPVASIIALLLFFQTIWAPVDKILSFATTLFSRYNEFQADEFSASLGMSAELQTGLCKISLENLGAMCPDPLYAVYHYSHPPLVERLSAMRESEKKSI